MKRNKHIVRKHRPRKPEDQLKQYSWIDDIEEQIAHDNKVAWIIEPWMKPKKYSQNDTIPIQQNSLEKKKSFKTRPQTREKILPLKQISKKELYWKPSLISFQQISPEKQRHRTLPQKKSQKILEKIQDKHKVKTIIESMPKMKEKTINLIQYPLTMNVKKKKIKYYSKIDKLLSEWKN